MTVNFTLSGNLNLADIKTKCLALTTENLTAVEGAPSCDFLEIA